MISFYIKIMENKALPLIDIKLKAQQLKRASQNFEAHSFLFRHAEEELSFRLQNIKKKFESVLNISFWPISLEGIGQIPPHSPFEPLSQEKYDLIVSCLSLHWVDQLPQYLRHLREHLKENGLFIGSFFAGDTLIELRNSYLKADSETYGGAYPRVLPMARHEDGPQLMGYAGFHEPVIDFNQVNADYSSLKQLLTDLRMMGESNALHARKKTPELPNFYKNLEKHYRLDYELNQKLPTTFEFLTLTGWK